MKLSAPGRAFRMSEEIAKENNKLISMENKSDYDMSHMSYICSGSHNSHCSKLPSETKKSEFSSLWQRYNDVTSNCSQGKILNHRSRVENIRKNRPSTATRRHVKKISEDFTITPTQHKSGKTVDGIFLKIDSTDLKMKDDKDISRSRKVIFSPKIQHRKMIRTDTICLKCRPLKNQVIPLPTPTSVKPPQKINNISLLSVTNTLHPSPKPPSNKPQKQTTLFPISQTASPSQPRQCKLQAERQVSARFMRRRKPQAASTGMAHGVFKVPFEQVKKAKLFAESAVREGKVFAIHGAFPAIREALVKRGWIEKILHSIPYMNPHPQNCACAHIGWHVPSSSHQHYHSSLNSISDNPVSHSSDLSVNSDSSGRDSSTVDILNPKRNKNQINANKEPWLESKENDSKEGTALELDEKSDVLEESSSEKSEGRCVLLNNLMESHNSQTLSTLYENDSTEIFINQKVYDNKIEEKTLEVENEKLHLEGSKELERNNEELSNNQNFNSEYLKKLTKTLNTTFLGPSEIREGIHKSINQKNLSIFQYSIPPYERKRGFSSAKWNFDSKSPKIDCNLANAHSEQEEINNQETEISEQDHLKISIIEELEEEVKNGGEKEEERCDTGKENQKESATKPFNPFPKLEYKLTKLDKPVVARVLRNVEPNFIWSWNRDSISFKHLSREQLVNRFPNTPFTTKFGLCETLQQLHWFSEAASVDTFVPRGYCIGHEDERNAFIHDYRTTACLNILKWLTEISRKRGSLAVVHQMGEVPVRRVRQALQHVERFIQTCCHDDLDIPPLSPLRENEWDLVFNAHYRIIHQGRKVKAPPHHVDSLLKECQSALDRVEPYWPQLHMDGVRNVWIVKPGAQSRGRGIFLLNHLEEILALVQSPLIYQTKYVVQKYMERPLLIHNTKFDIRQWFMVTDWNPLTLWMYKESYLRFCSQQFDLTNNDESIHLSNNAIQCKYMNGERDKELPEENMWDCRQFREYLSSQGKDDAYEKIIYPGMKNALIATMLAAQVQMDSFKHGFEFFGADFMLTEDLKPWLIEINSSPCMASTTSVTKRMCHESLNDTIKVVVDHRQNKSADTGKFEMIYHDKEKSVSSLPYHGVNLQVVGRQIWKPPLKEEKRRSKKIRPLPKATQPIPLITLHLEDSGNISLANACPILNCQNYSRKGPTLTAIVTAPPMPSANMYFDDPANEEPSVNNPES